MLKTFIVFWYDGNDTMHSFVESDNDTLSGVDLPEGCTMGTIQGYVAVPSKLLAHDGVRIWSPGGPDKKVTSGGNDA